MGENLSLLDYKVQEEVYQVVGTMTTLLANAGMHVVEMMNTYKVLPSIGEGGERLENARVVHEDDDEEMGEDQVSGRFLTCSLCSDLADGEGSDRRTRSISNYQD
jgi:hypothetical protein